MIPNIIHQIWIQGYDKIPAELKQDQINCRTINYDFEYMFWDEDKIKKLLFDNFDVKYLNLYNYYVIPAQRADLARYAILYIYGGIYLDMDMICKKNLKSFLENDIFFTNDIFNFLYKRYLTGIIGAKKNHPIFKLMMENMILRKDSALKFVAYSTGTQLFYDSVQQYMKDTGDTNISMIKRKYLHPCSILDDDLCAYKCDSCYVAHTNYSSWSPSLKLLKFAKRNTLLILVVIIVMIIFLFVKYNKNIINKFI